MKNKPTTTHYGDVTLESIKEAGEYIFNQPKPVEERKIKLLRKCNTYGMYAFGEHCQNEKCEPCNKSMKEFDKLLKEEIEKQIKHHEDKKGD